MNEPPFTTRDEVTVTDMIYWLPELFQRHRVMANDELRIHATLAFAKAAALPPAGAINLLWDAFDEGGKPAVRRVIRDNLGVPEGEESSWM